MIGSRIVPRLVIPVVIVAALGSVMNVEVAGAMSEVREVSGFSAVTLTTPGQLNIAVTGAESLTIEAEPHILPLLTSDVAAGRLNLGSVPFPPIVTSHPIVYNVTVKSVDDVVSVGAGRITVDGLDAASFTAALSGAGGIGVRGRADSFDLRISGSGQFSGQDFSCANAKVSINGSGSVILGVSNNLDTTIIGTGIIRYIGDPSVARHGVGVGLVLRA